MSKLILLIIASCLAFDLLVAFWASQPIQDERDPAIVYAERYREKVCREDEGSQFCAEAKRMLALGVTE